LIAETFLDTNILLYAAAGRRSAAQRHAIAQGLLTTQFGTSGQVLAEFYSNAVRRGPEPLSEDAATRWVELLAQKPFQPVDASLVQAAIEKSRRYDIPYGDAAILAAAEKLGCKTVYSDTLAHGKTYGSVRVVNPFLEDTSKEG